jgi:hypothetical protein
MIEDAVHKLLSESAAATLETMFFAAPDQVSMDPRRPAGELLAVRLTFQGAPPGWFGLVASEPVARTLAANFIGCEDGASLLPTQVSAVIGELANIMCGSVLSELESDANFDLNEPETTHAGAADAGPDFAAGSPSTCRFEFPEGALVFFFAFEERV